MANVLMGIYTTITQGLGWGSGGHFGFEILR